MITLKEIHDFMKANPPDVVAARFRQHYHEEPMDTETKETLPPLILFGDRVAIKPEDESVTKGGIFIPETALDDDVKHSIGIVRYVGPGSANDHGIPEGKMRCKVGMRVKYYTLRAVKLGQIGDESDLVVVSEMDVIGAVPPEEAAD